jgi:tetratricopeptide (TPR) repeat protein
MRQAVFALLLAACATAPREAPRVPPVVLPPPPPPAPPPAEVVTRLGQADAAFRAGRWAEAVRDYERVLALRDGSALTIHRQIGLARVELGDHAEALRHLQQVLDADPGDTAVRALMARAAIASGDPARALDLRLEATGAPTDVLFDLGARFVNANEPRHAIRYFTEALLRDPRHVNAYFRRAMACLQVGRDAEAKRDLRIVVALAPGTEQAESARQALARLR